MFLSLLNQWFLGISGGYQSNYQQHPFKQGQDLQGQDVAGLVENRTTKILKDATKI